MKKFEIFENTRKWAFLGKRAQNAKKAFKTPKSGFLSHIAPFWAKREVGGGSPAIQPYYFLAFLSYIQPYHLTGSGSSFPIIDIIGYFNNKVIKNLKGFLGRIRVIRIDEIIEKGICILVNEKLKKHIKVIKYRASSLNTKLVKEVIKLDGK